MPIAHGEGNFTADSDTLESLRANNQIVFRYSDAQGDTSAASNPNGAVDNIAGICNSKRNILGLMPHPERCTEQALGGVDGRVIWESALAHASA